MPQFQTRMKLFVAVLTVLLSLCIGSLSAVYAAVMQMSSGAALGYRWSHNKAVSAPSPSLQSAETALAADARGTVWLAFIEAEYHQLPNLKWGDWPRHVIVMVSHDQGDTFGERRTLGDLGGDQSIVADGSGGVLASWINYNYDELHRLQQKPMVQTITGPDIGVTSSIDCGGASERKLDQSSIYVDDHGIVHMVATDITPSIPSRFMRGRIDNDETEREGNHLQVCYARSSDHGRHFVTKRHIGVVGQLPQIVMVHNTLFVVGPLGYVVSRDDGTSFEAIQLHRFGDRLARVTASKDRSDLFVIGDSTNGGLWLQRTHDSGRTWQSTRVDTAKSASAWRYPAIHVDSHGRLHAVWMDDRNGHGAIYHAYSDDNGVTFSDNSRVSDQPFPFPTEAPPPAPANQHGNWIGDYLSLTSVANKVIVAWSDQRTGTAQSVVYSAVGNQP